MRRVPPVYPIYFPCSAMYSQALHIKQLYFAQIYYQVSIIFVQTQIVLIYDFVMFWMQEEMFRTWSLFNMFHIRCV